MRYLLAAVMVLAALATPAYAQMKMEAPTIQ